MATFNLSWILDTSSTTPPPVVPVEENYVPTSLELKGYILEPPRVGGSNSPFTLTPDNLVSDLAAFEVAYPATESAPRSEYMVQVLRESSGAGSGPGNKVVLPDALFGWTKNEGAVQAGVALPFERFTYAGQDQVFKPLQGAPRELVGVLQADANTVRLKVSVPPLLADLAAFPVRISVGASGSGTTFAVGLVSTFGLPPAGAVEMSQGGELNWNAGDIGSNLGSPVYFQRQTFYTPEETTGVIGVLNGDALILNPLPRSGQIPAIKIGSRGHLVAVERASEGVFSGDPGVGTVEWAADSGRLKFNSAAVASLGAQPVVYDGVFMGTFQVPTVVVGLAELTPCGTLVAVPSEEGDVYFRIQGVVQFPEIVFVEDFDPLGKQGQVQIRLADGAVQLSATDRIEHAGLTVEVVLPDVPLERGVSLRLFRSPVNPGAATAGVKDVTAIYEQTGAILADPIIGQPFVFLPALPREDAPLTVRVIQGTGSFVGELARLDVPSPPSGKGYMLDFETRQLSYAERRVGEILLASASDFSSVQLPNAPAFSTAMLIELENDPGVGNFITQVDGRDYVVDLGAGVVTYTQTEGEVIITGEAALSGGVLTLDADLIAAGAAAGDSVIILVGPSAGVYELTEVQSATTATVAPSFPAADLDALYEIRRGKEILADRFFGDVPLVDPNTSVERINALGPITNSPRLSVNPAQVTRVRFRFGKTSFSTSTDVVTSFTTPGSLATGVVEVDGTTGELNFSQSDVAAGGLVYSSLELVLGSEYTLQPELGFIEFADRMLEREETYLRYVVLGEDGETKIQVEERGAFLVPKEVVQPHPVATSALSFNPAGREVASTPGPRAFRGGRPQSSSQVQFDVASSTVTFQDDAVITDALPHGASVAPNENVYVDYYIHEAVGGEKNLSVTRPPMATVQVIISTEDESGNLQSSFTIEGDRTAIFLAQRLLEVDGTDTYLLAGSTFDGLKTTVTLDQTVPQYLRADTRNAPMRVSSGAVPRLTVGSWPPYFTLEGAPYDIIARGSKQVRLFGDLTRAYAAGSVIALTDSLTFQEYHQVEGATYDGEASRTILVLKSGVLRQHGSPTVLLRTIRPILSSPAATVNTSTSPLLTLPFAVYRRVEAEVGQVLVRERDYTIDDSGRVVFADELAVNEELGIFYTGVSVIDAGRRTRASWTFALVPSAANGLENQVLTMGYSTYSPDTFFYRVETLTNYRTELAEQFADQSKAASPSQGPVLSNSGETPLYEQGNPSLFFEEGALENQDLVARKTLLGFNNIINDIESFIQAFRGKVVGDHDGRFLFDGNVDNPVRSAFIEATNQIDDRIQVFGSLTQAKRAFEAANYSRFYPTQKVKYGAAADPLQLVTGDPILDLDEEALRTVVAVRNRAPWAVTTQGAPAGSTVFEVDHAQGDDYLMRPALNIKPNLKVAITTRGGTFLVNDGAPATVDSTSPTTVTLTSPVPVAVPKGATIRMASTDDVHRRNYTLGVDVGVDINGGFLTHISNEDIPTLFVPNQNPEADVVLDVTMQAGATNTAPIRFPALDGGTTDDDGNRQFPALSIDGGAELSSIETELALINAATGSLAGSTSPSFVGNGTVTSSTTITGTFSSPLPKIGDLFRVLTGGTEGTSFYHRISDVVGSTLTVEPPLELSSGAVTFEVTTGTALVTSIGLLTTTSILQDVSADFISDGVKPGHTVVGTLGTFAGQRRQVATVNSATEVSLSSPFSGTGAIAYEMVDSLATFGGPASLQQSWVDALVDELRSLEGQDFVDLSELIVEESTSQATTVTSIEMGAFSNLLVFVALGNNGSGSTAVASATFGGGPLTLLTVAASGNFSLHAYIAEALEDTTGDLVITATDTSPSIKIFALKLSGIKATFDVSTIGTAIATTTPATIGVPGLSTREAGDLVVSFAFTGLTSNEVYPAQGHDTLIPRFSGSGLSAVLTATRASAANQAVASEFRVVGSATTTGVVTVVLTKDVGADPIAGRALSEKAALERLFNDAAPDRGLGDLAGAISGAATMTGDFTNVAAGDVVFIRHGANAGVYTVATATDSSATIAELFPAAPEASVVFRAGRPSLIDAATLKSAYGALESVESAIVEAGALVLRHHSPILVYRNGTPSGGLPGTPDSSFIETGGRLVLGGAYARPVSSLAAREAVLSFRASSTDANDLEAVLSSSRLYDGRYVWIDGRINLETGTLPRKDRALENRQKALETIVKNLTKQLTT
jgi:hypothetical protein